MIYKQQLIEGLSNYQNDTLLYRKTIQKDHLAILIDEIIIAKIQEKPTINTEQLISFLKENKNIQKAFNNWNLNCQQEWQIVKANFVKNQKLTTVLEKRILETLNWKA